MYFFQCCCDQMRKKCNYSQMHSKYMQVCMYNILIGKIICFFLNDLRFYSWVKNIFKLAKITVNTNTQLKIPMSES